MTTITNDIEDFTLLVPESGENITKQVSKSSWEEIKERNQAIKAKLAAERAQANENVKRSYRIQSKPKTNTEGISANGEGNAEPYFNIE